MTACFTSVRQVSLPFNFFFFFDDRREKKKNKKKGQPCKGNVFVLNRFLLGSALCLLDPHKTPAHEFQAFLDAQMGSPRLDPQLVGGLACFSSQPGLEFRENQAQSDEEYDSDDEE